MFSHWWIEDGSYRSVHFQVPKIRELNHEFTIYTHLFSLVLFFFGFFLGCFGNQDDFSNILLLLHLPHGICHLEEEGCGETHTHHTAWSCPSCAPWSTPTGPRVAREAAFPAVQGIAKHLGASARMYFGQSWAATPACPWETVLKNPQSNRNIDKDALLRKPWENEARVSTASFPKGAERCRNPVNSQKDNVSTIYTATEQDVHRFLLLFFKQNSTWARPGRNRVFLKHLHRASSEVSRAPDRYQVLCSPAASPTPAKDFQGKNLTLPGRIHGPTLSIAELPKNLPLPSNTLILLRCLGSFSLLEGQQQPSQLSA